MPWVYILCGHSGRHYIGSAMDLESRFHDHCRGNTHTTKRLGGHLRIVASKEYQTLQEARQTERLLKQWKSPLRAIDFLKK